MQAPEVTRVKDAFTSSVMVSTRVRASLAIQEESIYDGEDGKNTLYSHLIFSFVFSLKL